MATPERKAIGCATVIALVVIAVVIGKYNGELAENERRKAAEAAAKAEAEREAKLTPEQLAARAKAAADAKAAKAAEDARQTHIDNTRTAAYACRDFVGRMLKDPDSAKWESPWYTDATISEKGSMYWIQVTARAKNSFGAYNMSTFD
jgi:sRNA-binding protein